MNGDDFVLLSDNFNQFAQIAAAAVTPASNSVAVTVFNTGGNTAIERRGHQYKSAPSR